MSGLAGIGGSATGVAVGASGGRDVPAAVRAGDPKAKQAYATALQFEQLLVGELSQSLVQGSGLEEGTGGSAGAGGDGASGGEGAGTSSLLSSLVPQALSESIMRGGGLGLAGSLTRALDPGADATATNAGASEAVDGAATRAASGGGTGTTTAGPEGGVAA